MGEEMKQCFDRERCDRDHFDRDCCDRDKKHECHIPDDDCAPDFDIGGWLPIIIIIFLLLGGTNIFDGFGGRGSCKDDCDDSGGFSWILIIIVIFLLFNNQNDGKGGFLDGLFR